MDQGAQIAGDVATKIVSQVAKIGIGGAASFIVSGITTVLGFVGDAVQRDKCKLICCPKENLPSVWGCKYQNRETCMGYYADYPGHGDHACWWNEKLNRCEVGNACRDRTFNFFSLFGSVCPPCDKCPSTEPQWNIAALKKADLPARFYVEPRDEFLWCAPRGSPGDCKTNKSKALCETSYADHNGDKNCVWDNIRKTCIPGAKCDDSRQRIDEAKKLGLQYYDGAWRRGGVPVSYTLDYNNDANRGGSSKENADVLRNAILSGDLSPGFVNCVKSCDQTNQQCFNRCILKYKDL
jgi:hypothetical protein